jgi:hypothetical protein
MNYEGVFRRKFDIQEGMTNAHNCAEHASLEQCKCVSLHVCSWKLIFCVVTHIHGPIGVYTQSVVLHEIFNIISVQEAWLRARRNAEHA